MKTILVLVNDAGGANLLSSLIYAEKDNYIWKVLAPIDSPAYSIFINNGLKNCLILCNPRKIVSGYFDQFNYDIVFFNPGWNYFPTKYLNYLNIGKRKTVAFLDHWIDYRERFGYPKKGWQDALPHFIALSDSKAYKMALNLNLPNLVKVQNYYLINQLKRFEFLAKQQRKKSHTLLFLSQIISDSHKRNKNYTYIGCYEKNVIKEIIENFDSLSNHLGVNNLRIRLHPSNNKFKYSDIYKYSNRLKLEVERANDNDLLESISDAHVIMGMNSMSLFISYVCGKPSISFIPGESIKCTLPLPQELCVKNISEIYRISNAVFKPSKTGLNLFLNRNLNCLFRDINVL